jgi:protein transport protein SEC24
LPVADAAAALFKAADLDAHLVATARSAASLVPGAPLASVRDGALSRATAILGAYRRHCATSSSAAQLILPEALKLLPLYTLAMLKSPLLKADARPDDRALWHSALLSGGCGKIPALLHARLLPFHRIYLGAAAAVGAGGGAGGADLAAFVQAALPPARPLPLPQGAYGSNAPRPLPLPDALPLSSEALESGGVYLAENGSDALLFVDRDAPAEIVRELFGPSFADADALCRAPQCPPLLLQGETRAAKLLAELLARLRTSRGAFMRLRVARRGDPQWEPAFGALLAEDRAPASAGGGMSYVEFLCHVHRQVQNRMG